MPNRLSLSDLAIRHLPIPPAGTATYWDTATRGFGVRVQPGGAKTFIALIGSGRRQAIGRYPIISLKEARAECGRILAEKTLGRVRPTHTAYEDSRDRFLKACEQRNRPRTVQDYKRHLVKHYPFGRKSVADITPRDILQHLDQLSGVPSERHHAFTTGRAFFAWCERQHLIDTSPMAKLDVPPTNAARERVLADAELGPVFKAALSGRDTFHRIVALLVLTGQRKGEIGNLQWDWIDEKKQTITLPATLTKNKRSHIFPYNDLAAEVLASVPRIDKGPYVFPAEREQVRGKPATVFRGFGKSKDRFDKQVAAPGTDVEHWTLHDLRRTFSSGMAALGVSQTVVEKLLNHVSGGTLSPIAAVYNRYSYFDEMRDALQRWQTHLHTLLSGPESIDGDGLRGPRQDAARALHEQTQRSGRSAARGQRGTR